MPAVCNLRRLMHVVLWLGYWTCYHTTRTHTKIMSSDYQFTAPCVSRTDPIVLYTVLRHRATLAPQHTSGQRALETCSETLAEER